jgi:hypothetical protein
VGELKILPLFKKGSSMSQAKKEAVTPKKNLKYERDKAREIVKGIFKFYEVPGGSLSFVFREFKEDKTERYDMMDGEIYSIPLGVARHLNKNGWYPLYNFVPGDNSMQTGVAVQGFANNSVQKITQKVRRFAFNSLEFVDVEDMPHSTSSVVTVESV